MKIALLILGVAVLIAMWLFTESAVSDDPPPRIGPGPGPRGGA